MGFLTKQEHGISSGNRHDSSSVRDRWKSKEYLKSKFVDASTSSRYCRMWLSYWTARPLTYFSTRSISKSKYNINTQIHFSSRSSLCKLLWTGFGLPKLISDNCLRLLRSRHGLGPSLRSCYAVLRWLPPSEIEEYSCRCKQKYTNPNPYPNSSCSAGAYLVAGRGHGWCGRYISRSRIFRGTGGREILNCS